MTGDHATWVCLTNEEMEGLRDILQHGFSGLNPMNQRLLEIIGHYEDPSAKDQRYRDAAEGLNFVREGECEIDDWAVVSKGDDSGAYVMAWVWVTDEQAGIDPEEEE